MYKDEEECDGSEQVSNSEFTQVWRRTLSNLALSLAYPKTSRILGANKTHYIKYCISKRLDDIPVRRYSVESND